MPRANRALAGLAVFLGIGLAAWSLAPAPRERSPMGLMTSLAIVWSNAELSSELDAYSGSAHPALQAMEQGYRVTPIDTLATPGATTPSPQLARLDHLLLAQPPALAPADLVALDSWVRDGGTLVILADPMPDAVPGILPGDLRAPQSPVSLGPLFARWGLVLRLWPDGGAPPDEVLVDRSVVPLREPGRLEAYGTGHDARCELEGKGIVARCTVGKGRALLLADSALLAADCSTSQCRRALENLLGTAFESR